MQVKYLGQGSDFKICRRNFSQEYSFVDGVCKSVDKEDAEKLVAGNPACFSIVKVTPKKKVVKKAPFETMDTKSE